VGGPSLRRRNGVVAIARRGLAIALGALLLAGCGGGGHRSERPGRRGQLTGRTISPLVPPRLQVVASLPLTGPQADQGIGVLDGMRMALAQAGDRAGPWRIVLDAVGNAGSDGTLSLARVLLAARTAALHQDTIVYIGGLQTDASVVSIPLLAAAGVPQIVLGSPDTRLRSDVAPTIAAERAGGPAPMPFLRLTPSNAVEAAGILADARRLGCRRMAIPHDSSPDGENLAAQIASEARRAGVTVPPGADATETPNGIRLGRYLALIARDAVGCAAWAGGISDGGVGVTRAILAELPAIHVIGATGVCSSAWADPARGLPVSIDSSLRCVAPYSDPQAPAGEETFLSAYQTMFGRDPEPLSAYGYEAMRLTLSAISGLGRAGDDRDEVGHALSAERAARSPIGAFSFDRAGDATDADSTLYRVAAGGRLVASKTLSPPRRALR
jgi:ABC-type branched-subunit amino acid transport system substrate-binding protein